MGSVRVLLKEATGILSVAQNSGGSNINTKPEQKIRQKLFGGRYGKRRRHYDEFDVQVGREDFQIPVQNHLRLTFQRNQSPNRTCKRQEQTKAPNTGTGTGKRAKMTGEQSEKWKPP
jgi:hypothetical protein